MRPLTTDPAGSIIGSLTGDENAITDVDSDVPRQHLRIWFQDGRWLAQGLDSTNGSFLISGVDRCRQAIEPPRRERSANFANTPVEIHNGDTLCLGATTRFFGHSHHRLVHTHIFDAQGAVICINHCK